MEEFDSEDFSSSEEDEDYVPSGKRFLLKRLAPPRDPREATLARRSWARWPVSRVSSIPDRRLRPCGPGRVREDISRRRSRRPDRGRSPLWERGNRRVNSALPKGAPAGIRPPLPPR